MIFNFDTHALKPGIYRITNMHNNRVYIGQSGEFKHRWASYKRNLPKGIGHNNFMCRDYLKCLAELEHDNFLVFSVIEVMEGSTKVEREIREEYYIDQIYDNQILCYNFRKDAKPCERSCYSHTPEETSKLLSEASQKRWEIPGAKEKAVETLNKRWQELGRKENYGNKIKTLWQTEEYKKKQTEFKHSQENVEHFKQLCHTPETIEKVSRSQIKNHGKIISPTGEVFEVIGLKQFCTDHNIPLSNLGNLQKVMNGVFPSVLGWRKYSDELIGTAYVNKLTGDHFNSKSFKLISPDGKIFEGTNVTQFCKIHGLQQQNITKVLSGKRNSHKGWYLPKV